jgi:dihydroorotate dehydrogenase
VSGWRSLAFAALRPLLFRFDSERIHRLTMDALRIAGENTLGRPLLRVAGGVPRRRGPWVELMGLRFRTRVGLAAGWDKDAVALRGWEALGFGFAEVGTVTPEPQPGNPRPRLFRLVEDRALVNRMGFNNDGAVALARRVMLARRHLPDEFVVGVNIGRGKDTPTERAVDDYVAAARVVAPVADYLAVNVSSPNTPGLRELQEPRRLLDIVTAVVEQCGRTGRGCPLLVKISPDLERVELDELLPALIGAGVAGVIIGNTTVRREGLRSPAATEEGGLSGAPLLPRTLTAVRDARALLGSDPAIVACGGLFEADDVAEAYAAGADLVQLWTGLVYRGPGLVGEATRVTRLVPSRAI